MRCFKGEKNNFYGKHHSIESRKKISAAMSGRTLSEEHKRRIQISMTMRKNVSDEELELWKKGYSLDEAQQIIAERKRIEKEQIAAEKELERQKRLDEMKRVRENGLSEEDIKMPQVMIMRKYKLKWVELQELMNSYYSKRKWYNKLMSSR